MKQPLTQLSAHRVRPVRTGTHASGMSALWLTLLVMLCACCSRRPLPAGLLAVNSLADTYPDSALSLLQTWQDSMSSAPEAERMYYTLLTVKAKDKAYIPHTSDSTILQVLSYYKDKGDKRFLPEAYYLTGRVYADLGDAPQALEYFFKAKEEAEPTDYDLLNRTYSQIGSLFVFQSIYDKALSAFQEAYHYSLLKNNNKNIIFGLRDLGLVYSYLQIPDSAILYYKKADNLAIIAKNQDLREVINGELANYYTELGRYKEAHKCLQVALYTQEEDNMYPIYYSAAEYYFYTNQLDSAAYYYKALTKNGNYYQKQSGYKGLGQIARLKGEYQKAFSYIDNFFSYTDSVTFITKTESVQKVNALYNYQIHKKKYIRLLKENGRQKIYIFCILVIFITISSLAFAYIQQKRRKEEERINQQRRLRQLEEYKYRQSQAFIEENKKRIKQLEQELSILRNPSNALQHNLYNAQKWALEKANEQVVANNIMEKEATIVLKASDIYKKFHTSNKNMSEQDWKELAKTIDETFNAFTKRLSYLYAMSEIELRVCLLLKIEIPISHIPNIVTRSKQGVASIRKRLLKKVLNKDGAPGEWDQFIRSF